MSIGKYYSVNKEYRISKRVRAESCLAKYFSCKDASARKVFLHTLFGSVGTDAVLEEGFRCVFGSNTYLGKAFSCGENVSIDDHAPVYIGNNVHIGNNVRIRTLMSSGQDGYIAKPVYIGDNVSINDDVIIEPGAIIGYNSIVTN
ncbi:MAG: hypothetical protein IKF46_06095 [Erysipelotrichaceae bacterium]|nr:hypothetical protein [Erysipelotrichaceae bacterium]